MSEAVTPICSTCQKPVRGALRACGQCHVPLCKSCAQVAGPEAFAFIAHQDLPAELRHDFYCGPCFDAQVAPALAEYESAIARAGQVYVFGKDQAKETRLIKRKEPFVQVQDCADEREAILRLAFQAAQKGFNAIIDVDLRATKVKNHSYQTTIWSGRAIPAQMTARQAGEDRLQIDNPN